MSKRWRALVDEDVAALMVTNPNTVGVFEENITEVAEILHAKGAHGLHGRREHERAGRHRAARRFRRRRDASESAQDIFDAARRRRSGLRTGGGEEASGAVPAAAAPRSAWAISWTWNYDLPQSVGRVRAFYGNFGVLVRALAYIMAHGGDGLRNATMDAVLNANYIREAAGTVLRSAAYQAPTMHECVFSDDRQAKRGVRTGDIAKRLIDYGFHPYTVSFPLIVHGAMMIEPTETESKPNSICSSMR